MYFIWIVGSFIAHLYHCMKSLLLILFVASLSGSGTDDGPKASKRTKHLPLGTLARCTGSSSCRACSNCTYCGHCAGGGGTCGVCSSSAAPVRTYRATPTRTQASRRSTSGGSTAARPKTVLRVAESYTVAATTLNLRAEPSAEAKVVRVLTAGDVVTVLELINEKWVRVTVESADLGDAEGYVSRAYLVAQP